MVTINLCSCKCLLPLNFVRNLLSDFGVRSAYVAFESYFNEMNTWYSLTIGSPGPNHIQV